MPQPTSALNFSDRLRLHSPHSCASSSKRRSSRRWVEIYCRQFLMTALCVPPFLCAAFLVSTTRLQKSNGTGQSACSCSQHGKTSIKHSLFSLTVPQFFHYSQDIDNKCKGWLPLQKGRACDFLQRLLSVGACSCLCHVIVKPAKSIKDKAIAL